MCSLNGASCILDVLGSVWIFINICDTVDDADANATEGPQMSTSEKGAQSTKGTTVS
jgi:hypothetical protein